MQSKLWMWGYAQETVGVPIPFTGTTKSYCSLESAADYFRMSNMVFMNSMHSLEHLEENLALLASGKKMICGIPHGAEKSVEGAEKISALSLKFPAISGIVLDDFLQLSGHPTTPELVGRIRDALHSCNPNLELWTVMYSDVNHLDVTPYLPFIDGFMLWRWVSTETFWKAELGMLLHKYKALYGKKVMHGVYLQNYGESGNVRHPMDLELWKLQWTCLLQQLREPSGFLDGVILLQNGWVGDFAFRDQVVWLKETLDWFFTVNTER